MYSRVLTCLKELGFERVKKLHVKSKYEMFVVETDGARYLVKTGHYLSPLEEHYCETLSHCPYIAIPKFVRCGDLEVSIRDYFEEILSNAISHSALEPSTALQTLIDVSKALLCIHSADLVYTDLKPENIGLKNRHAWLIDLDSLTRPFTKPRFITMSRAPPEYLSMGIVFKESDNYQLGLLIDEVVTNCRRLDNGLKKELKSLSSKLKRANPFERLSLENVIEELQSLARAKGNDEGNAMRNK